MKLGKFNFDMIKIGLASPEMIRKWSYGEVTKPETINYRTLKPEKDGLFCEKIFGPVKDWECHCGKYKRYRYKNMKCDVCGVEVTLSKVRRSRLGHINLAAPVSHIWFFKGTPSKMGYLLDIPIKKLERVLYYIDYMVTYVNKEKINSLLERISEENLTIDKLMPSFKENILYETVTDNDEHFLSNIKLCETSFLGKERSEIQNILKSLQGKITENEVVELHEKEFSKKEKLLIVTKDIDGENKVIGHLPQIYSKFLIEYLKENKYEAFLEKITKSVVDKRKFVAKIKIKFENNEIPEKIVRKINPYFRKCEEMYSKIYLEEGLELLRNLKQNQTLHTGIITNQPKDVDSATFREEERIFTEIYEIDFFIPYEFEKLQKLFDELAIYYNISSVKDYYNVGMGAEAVKEVLAKLDLDKLSLSLREEIKKANKQKLVKLLKRLQIVESFRKSGNKPEWMILDVLPVLPPDLRPMVQLEGGRFASSDLNDLYRRVINRNNRLKKLLEIRAPESIIRNEKRMLQEAVDALLDNGRRGKVVVGSNKRPLKSLSDLLRGKQGRFRQNLLGKRVDYSGRSVIVVGPKLKLHQCGLPKEMALELFKPFCMKELVERGIVHNIKSAKRLIEHTTPEVWEVLEDIVKDKVVLLNRAPTLHRLGIQAFEPILVEGKAIQIHPLVCGAYNADFDGDQMAVHLPLSHEAQAESYLLLMSINNILYPADGSPIVTPTRDMIIGCYYLTLQKHKDMDDNINPDLFYTPEDVINAYEIGLLSIFSPIKICFKTKGEPITTTVGRVIFNSILPEEWEFINEPVEQKMINEIVARSFREYGSRRTVELLDDLKEIGFKFATKSGLTISIDDVKIPKNKVEIIEAAKAKEEKLDFYFKKGLLSEKEHYDKVVEVWQTSTEEMTEEIKKEIKEDPFNPFFMMAASGARGTVQQIRQLSGLRGLMSDPTGKIIRHPITANFKEGLNVLDYFISTHGARKGLADTALRTADSGYLTRRLVDVAQDIIIREKDCQTDDGIEINSISVGGEEQVIVKKLENTELNLRTGVGEKDTMVIDAKSMEGIEKSAFAERMIGRIALSDIRSIEGDVLVKGGEMITYECFHQKICSHILRAPVIVRSPLGCKTYKGLCAKCYGMNFATGVLAEEGDAVGIMAAQSIGEPGTQLTMRTFHTGGVMGPDITQGLPRVEELFEARKPRVQALISNYNGTIEKINEGTNFFEITIKTKDKNKIKLKIASNLPLIVKENMDIKLGDKLTEGYINPHELLTILGEKHTQAYIIKEVLSVYKRQGVATNEKHIEVIIRELLRFVKIESGGDTTLIPGSLYDKYQFKKICEEAIKTDKIPPKARPVLLGITKYALTTESFLSAASFQETTRVLADAAAAGKIDVLFGLKENVIIGNLIPAGTGLTIQKAYLPDSTIKEPIAISEKIDNEDQFFWKDENET